MVLMEKKSLGYFSPAGNLDWKLRVGMTSNNSSCLPIVCNFVKSFTHIIPLESHGSHLLSLSPRMLY